MSELTQENLDYIGTVYGFQLHPMVHDLIIEIKRLQKEVEELQETSGFSVIEELGKECTYLTTELAAEREAHRWIPVSEKLPEDENEVLVILGGKIFPMIGFYLEREKGWYLEPYNNNCSPTHWQPLPEPPKE
jgi:hypothetical protein